MAPEFDLLVDVPAFAAYALPPEAFPGFSAGSYGGSARGTRGIAHVEYLYRPDYDIRGRMLGVSNTRPSDGDELLREDPLWWASGRMRIHETIRGDFLLTRASLWVWARGTWEKPLRRSKVIPANCSVGRRFPSTRSMRLYR